MIKGFDSVEKSVLSQTTKLPTCITGMHRSGTSMITRLLNLCGLYLGPLESLLPPKPDNPEGFWELSEITEVNNSLLERFGGSWHQPPMLFPQTFEDIADIGPLRAKAAKAIALLAGQEFWGWKDPRASLTLSFWRDLLGDLKVVICLRNPLDVADSLVDRGTPINYGYHLWGVYYHTLLEQAQGLPCLVTHYDSYFLDPKTELQRVLDFVGLEPTSEQFEQAVESVKNPLRKHSSNDLDLLKSDVPLEVVAQYLQLCERAGPVYKSIKDKSDSFQGLQPSLHGLPVARADILALRLERLRQETADYLPMQHELEHRQQIISSLEQHTKNLEFVISELRENEQNLHELLKNGAEVVQDRAELVEANQNWQEQIRSLYLQIDDLRQQVASREYDRSVLLKRNQKLEQELQDLTLRFSHYQQYFGGESSTYAQRATRAFGIMSRQLHQNFSFAANGLAAPVVRAIKRQSPIIGSLDSPGSGAKFQGEVEIKGWVISSVGPIERVEVYLNDVLLGQADYGKARPDVVNSRTWQWQLECGFSATLPFYGYQIKPGEATLTVLVVDRQNNQKKFTAVVVIEEVPRTELPAVSDHYQEWIIRNEPNTWDLEQQGRAALNLTYRPLFSLICPVYNTPEKYLRAMIASVVKQTYDNWELCIADGASTNPATRRLLLRLAESEPRIKLKLLDTNLGIGGNSNAAIELAQGEFIGLLDHDDELAPNALYEFAQLLIQNPEADIIYSDEDKLDPEGRRCMPFFKPDWSPEYFYSLMYTCHLGVYRTSLVRQIGGFHRYLDGSQDHDLVLRLIEITEKVYHIPRILYHWRMSETSSARDERAKTYVEAARIRALNEHAARTGIQATAEPGLWANTTRLRYHLTTQPEVSIIIPTRDRVDLLRQCITSIWERSTYQNYKIVVVDNNSSEPETLKYFEELATLSNCRVLPYHQGFNFSAINNFAVKHIDSELILFLNNDTEVISPEWLEAMIEHAQRPQIGAVGARLLYTNRTLQHAGVIVGLGGVAGHAHKHLPAEHAGYFCRALTVQNFSAVTAACLMMRTALFKEIGGFNDINLTVAFNDVDLCLRIRKHGYRIAWTPYAELYHHESISRGEDFAPEKLARFQSEIRYMQQHWAKELQYDPYYNPNLTLDRENFSYDLISRVAGLEKRVEPSVELREPETSVAAPDLPYQAMLANAGARGQVLGRNNIYNSGPPSPIVSPEVISLVNRYNPSSMLDVGCGIGALVQEMQDRNIEVVGIEINPEYVKQAQELGRNAQLYDGKAIPFGDEAFDTVVSIEVLEHIPDWENTFYEMLRVARRHILISVPNIGLIPHTFKHNVVPWHLLESTHVNFFTKEIWASWLAKIENITVELQNYGEFVVNGETYYNHVFVAVTKQE